MMEEFINQWGNKNNKLNGQPAAEPSADPATNSSPGLDLRTRLNAAAKEGPVDDNNSGHGHVSDQEAGGLNPPADSAPKNDFHRQASELSSNNLSNDTYNQQINNYNINHKPPFENRKLFSNPQPVLSPERKKQRQLLMVLPLLVLPFISMAFWALGGGSAAEPDNKRQADPTGTGINTTIPAANLTEGVSGKVTLYREAAKLAAARKNARQQDGRLAGSLNGQSGMDSLALPNTEELLSPPPFAMQPGFLTSSKSDPDSNTIKVSQRLAALQQIIARAKSAGGTEPDSYGQLSGRKTAQTGSANMNLPAANISENTNKLHELDRVSAMIAAASDNDSDSAETSRINAMLDKVLAIQQGYGDGHANTITQTGGGQSGMRPVNEDLPKTVVGRTVKAGLGQENTYHFVTGKPGREVPLLASTPREGLLGQRRKSSADPVVVAAQIGKDSADQKAVLGEGPLVEPGVSRLPTAQSDIKSDIKGAFYDIDGQDRAVFQGNTKDTNNTSKGSAKGKRQPLAVKTIAATVATTQTLTAGSTIKIRLDEDMQLNGVKVPKGSFVFGICSINAERLRVAISHIRHKKQLLPVHLKVFDLDGLEGIHIPGSINRAAAKQGVGSGLSSVQLMSMDASVAAQAASAGVEAAKGLFAKKARLIRVSVKAGYPILLVDP